MPRIFLKPNSPEFAAEENRTKGKAHICNMPGCTAAGEHRAPKDRGLHEYYNFCQEHAREYNAAWNFFSGMSDAEVQAHMHKSLYGDRPTWRYGVEGETTDALKRKIWQTYHFTEETPSKRERVLDHNTPEAEALAVMDLSPPVTLEAIRERYRALAKKHHPDLNGGSAESEELLKRINMAYTILKLAYEKFDGLAEL
ncbi:MAG: J domain-containing protein [Alphaproteobacteria bacterium]|nr:J domain-containing protein [Alphaproteobacteria bacterium]